MNAPMPSRWLVALVMACSIQPAAAQTTDGGFDKALSPSLAKVANSMHSMIRTNLADAAESMTEGDYAFRPTAEVRTRYLRHVGQDGGRPRRVADSDDSRCRSDVQRDSQ
jgi:hypothetical protein